MSIYTTSTVQFTHTADFLADLHAGHVAAVYHEFLPRPGFASRDHTIVRAIVLHTLDEVDPPPHAHIAAIAFIHDSRVIAANGRDADEVTHRLRHRAEHLELIDQLTSRLATIGILADRIRVGILTLPYTVELHYASDRF